MRSVGDEPQNAAVLGDCFDPSPSHRFCVTTDLHEFSAYGEPIVLDVKSHENLLF